MNEPNDLIPLPGSTLDGFLRVGERTVDLGGHRMADRAPAQRLTPKAVGVLLTLARHQGRTVTTEQLLDAVWPDTCPTPDVVRQAVSELRRALEDSAKSSRHIETIAKVGYRMVAECTWQSDWPMDKEGGEVAGPERPADPRPIQAIPPLAWLSLVMVAAAAVMVVLLWPDGKTRPPITLLPGEAVPTASEVRMITSRQTRDTFPRLSPDGSRFSFASLGADGVTRIFVSGVDGGGLQEVSRHQLGQSGYPAWSPDGSSIAYFYLDQGGCQIVVAPALGGVGRSYDACDPRDIGPFDWFPAGDALLLSQRVAHDSRVQRLYRLELDTGLRSPHGHHDPNNTINQAPVFSPDGNWIAVRRGAFPIGDLWLLPTGGGASKRLTSVQTHMWEHAWLPESDGLVFGSSHSGHIELYSVALSNGRIRPLGIRNGTSPQVREDGLLIFRKSRHQVALTPLPAAETPDGGLAEAIEQARKLSSTGSEYNPVFSPDGRLLAFLSTRTGREQIWIYDRANDDVFQLTTLSTGDVKAPGWDHQSRRLLIPVREGELSVLYEADVAQRSVREIWRDPRFIDSAAFGESGQRWVTLVEEEGTFLYALDPRPKEMSARPTGVAASRSKTQPDDPAVYFSEPGTDHVGRFDPATGEARILSTRLAPWQWQLDGGTIHMMERIDLRTVALWQLEVSTGTLNHFSPASQTHGLELLEFARADRDPHTGEWFAPTVIQAYDDIAAIDMPALLDLSGMNGEP